MPQNRVVKGLNGLSAKIRAARLSVASNTFLSVVKLVIGLAIGSVSMLSEAINSGIDVMASLITLFSVGLASQPADREHRYGHGKVENLAALIQGILLLLAAGWISFEAVRHLQEGRHPTMITLGLWVMGSSAVLNWFVSGHLFRVARQEGSMALEADAVNLRTDVWTASGVFAGLLAVRVTGLVWVDPVMAMLVAALIAKSGLALCRQSLQPLVDARLPSEEEEEIIRLIEEHSSEFVEFHDLRTRQAGAERHIDFHLVVHGHKPLEDVHKLCDEIENAIANRFHAVSVLIHPEPCEPGCDLCVGLRTRRRRLAAAPTGRRVRGSLVRQQASEDFSH